MDRKLLENCQPPIARENSGHAGRVTLAVRKRIDHRGPLSIDVSSAWYFITVCADGHKPWVADEMKIGRAGAPRPPKSGDISLGGRGATGCGGRGATALPETNLGAMGTSRPPFFLSRSCLMSNVSCQTQPW